MHATRVTLVIFVVQQSDTRIFGSQETIKGSPVIIFSHVFGFYYRENPQQLY